MRRSLIVLGLIGVTFIGVSTAQSPAPISPQVLSQLRDEGLARSQVMEHIGTLSDVYGARVTGSPAMRQASDFAMKKFAEWGLTNVHREAMAVRKGLVARPVQCAPC